MPNKNTHRLLRQAAALAVGVAGFAMAGPAQAACATHATSQSFAPFGDTAQYFAAPDGTFEAGGAGWLIGNGNASVAAANDSYRVGGGGSKSLRLSGPGATATSPAFCIDLTNPTVRLMYTTSGNLYSGSYVQVEAIMTSMIGTTTSIIGQLNSNGGWTPSTAFDLRGVAAAHFYSGIAANTTAQLKLRFTVVNPGATFNIDDVMVDPFKGG